MRVNTKAVIDAYKAHRFTPRMTKSALSSEQEEKLRQQIEETRRILRQEEGQLGFADILQALIKPAQPSEQH